MSTVQHTPAPATRGIASRRTLLWALLTVLAALVTYAAFRGYLNPELLIHFANSLYC